MREINSSAALLFFGEGGEVPAIDYTQIRERKERVLGGCETHVRPSGVAGLRVGIFVLLLTGHDERG